jgi:hypothetical protein
MIRSVLAAGIALVMTVANASAQAEPEANNPLITWHGAIAILGLSAACNNLGFVVGDYGKSIYRPRLVADEPASAITLLFARSAGIFTRASGGSDKMHGAGNYRGGWISGRATGNGSTSGQFRLAINPVDPVAATTFIDIQGSLTNFANTAGCTLSFRGGYARRPN